MAIERARQYLAGYGIADRVLEFEQSSATVELAARAVGCEPERIAKTLSFKLADGCILVVAAGDAKVDNGKYKAQFGAKAKMLAADEVEQCIGHDIGGVCPFGIEPGVRVYLDESLKRFDTVYPACGSANSAVPLTPAELEQYTPCTGWVDVCKGWQPQ